MDRMLYRAGAGAALACLVAALAAAQETERRQDEKPGGQDDPSMRSQSLQKVRQAIDRWDAQSWDEVLAEDVSLVVRMADMIRRADGSSSIVSLRTEIRGKEKVKQALENLYQGYPKQISITSEFLSGREAVLLGDVKVMAQGRRDAYGRPPQKQGKSSDHEGRKPAYGQEKKQPREGEDGMKKPDDTVPVAIHMRFNQEGKIDRLTIASFDLKAVDQGRQEQTPEQK